MIGKSAVWKAGGRSPFRSGTIRTRRAGGLALASLIIVGLAPSFSPPAVAQSTVNLVCRVEEAYSRGRGIPVGWRYRGMESFTIPLGLQRRFGDGSCCYVDVPVYRITVLPDQFIFWHRNVPRERFGINRFTGRMNGSWGISGTFVRGACRPGQRRF